MSSERVPLGTSPFSDTEDVPDVENTTRAFPAHTAAALIAVYLLGYLGWHWAYVVVLFWLLVRADERRLQRIWAVTQREARADAAAAGGAESATWVNELVRAVWPMYEGPIARWAIGKMQPMIDASIIGNKIGVKLMRIKSFSFGSVDQRRTDGRHRLAPILFDKVQMVSKSVEAAPGSRDPRLHRIRYVLLADVRWHAGSQPSLTLDIQLGPKFLSLVSVDAEVRDLIGSGTLRLELDWVRPYPWLGTLYASFVKTPSIDFKLSLGGSPDVMDLAPPLRKHLKSMLDRTLVEAMVAPRRLCIPFSEWYGEGGDPDALVSTVTAAMMAAPYMPPRPVRQPLAPHQSTAAAVQRQSSQRRRSQDDSAIPSSTSNAHHHQSSDDLSESTQLAVAISRAVANRLERRRRRSRQGIGDEESAAEDVLRAAGFPNERRLDHFPIANEPRHRSASDDPHYNRSLPPSPRAGRHGNRGDGLPMIDLGEMVERSGSADTTALASDGFARNGNGHHVMEDNHDSYSPPPLPANGNGNNGRAAGFMTSDEFFGVGFKNEKRADRPKGAGDTSSRPESASSMDNGGGARIDPLAPHHSSPGHGPSHMLPQHARLDNLRRRPPPSIASSSDGELSRHLPKRDAAAPPSPLLPALTSEPPHRLGHGGGGFQLEPTQHHTTENGSHFGALAAENGHDDANGQQPGGMRGLVQWALAAKDAWESRRREGASEHARQLAAAAALDAALASGAVGELHIDVLHATGLVTETQRRVAALSSPNLAPTLIFSLTIDNEYEARGAALNARDATPYVQTDHRMLTSGGAMGETTRLEVNQQWRLPVHDSLTQRLRLRVLIKELAKELTVLCDAELPLADLRLNTPAARAVVFQIKERRDPALLHLRLTYRLLGGSNGGVDHGAVD